MKRFAPIAMVAAAGVLIGAVAVGVSQMVSGTGKVPVAAAVTASATPEARKAQLEAFAKKNGLTIKSTFDAGKGIEVVAYMPNEGGQGGVFYHLADGSFVAGQYYDAAGTLLTEAHFKQAWPDGLPTPESAADMAAATKALDSAAMTTVGDSGPEVYMFYEPHCGFCQKSYEALKGLKVKVHYLPVAFLTQDSEALVAAMLKGEPNIMDKIHDPAQRPALIAKYQDQVAEVRPLIEKNAQVMRLAGIQGTPGYLWKGKDGTSGAHRGYLDRAGLEGMLAQIAVDQGVKVADSGAPTTAEN